MKISVRIYHDCRSRTISEGDPCPVKLCVYFNRKRKYFAIVRKNGVQLKLTKAQYEQVTKDRPRKEAKHVRALLDAEISRARRIIENMQGFDFAQFERAYTGNMAGLSLTADMKEIAADMKRSSKNVYLYALKSLSDFLGKKEVSYADLTPRIITNFVKHLEKQKSADTIKTYMGAIKAAVSRTKKFGELPEDYNPFKAYEAPKGKKRQLSLSVTQFDAIVNYTGPHQYARDVFLFCTLCNGQYTATVFRLKKSDIRGNWIHYKRQKTDTILQAFISPVMREIIDKYPGKYIFPELTKKGNADILVDTARRKVNDGLKKISAELKKTNLHFPSLTVKYCRGTYLKLATERGGLSFEQASRTAGHSSTKMSEHYYSGRNLEEIEAAAKKIG